MDALEAVRARRSIGRLVPPGPDDDELRTILGAAACAPDHGELRPFRFTVLRGAASASFGALFEEAYRARCAAEGTDPDPARALKERTKLERAPLVVVVSYVHQASDKIPATDQRDAVAAAAQNLLVAATALGYGSMWRTGKACDDDGVRAALGLGLGDAVVGFLYLGTVPPGAAKPPRRPDLAGLVTDWQPPAG
jgi:nitroreductase